jgi:carotenoid 1,2-hydratase
MIHLSPSGSGLSPRLLEAPGGFLWWYLDLVDAEGNGVVVIWSFGLPFLPGYASAARRGAAPAAGQRPVLNVSIYRSGVLDLYLLQEFRQEEVWWDATSSGDSWSFGRSRLSSQVEGGLRRVELDLHLEIPGMDSTPRLHCHAQGPGVFDAVAAHDPGHRLQEPLPTHDWTPLLCAAEGRVVLEGLQGREQFTGHVYHDRNGGRLPLHELGIERWIWGRVALPSMDFIFYVLQGPRGEEECLFLEVGRNGRMWRVQDCALRLVGEKRTLGGLTWWPTMVLERRGEPFLRISKRSVVDSGPFYQRDLFVAEDACGGAYPGISEICEPRRVDLARHRLLVKMRVERRGERNSMWLPLFSGPRTGRVRRLLRSMMPGPGEPGSRS